MALFEKEETILKSARQSHFFSRYCLRVCSLKKPGNLVKNIYYLQMKVSQLGLPFLNTLDISASLDVTAKAQDRGDRFVFTL